MKENLDQYNNKFVVYLMTFPNGKKYCGYSSNIKRRWRSESEYANQVVYNAIKKYGWNNIQKEVLYSYDNKEQALLKEKQLIEELDLLNENKGYNKVPGGGDPPHGKHFISSEGLEKMRLNGIRLAKEIWENPEKAEYVKKRMKEEDHKARMNMTEEERKQSFGAHNIGRIPANAKPIYQINLITQEVIAEYPSAGQAAIALGNFNYSKNIRRTANGTGKSAYGYGWRWKT